MRPAKILHRMWLGLRKLKIKRGGRVGGAVVMKCVHAKAQKDVLAMNVCVLV